MSVHWPVLRKLIRRPLRTVIVDDQRSWRGVELLIGAMHIAAELDRRGVSKHVAYMLPSSGASAMCALGAWISGRVCVPLNFLLKPEELQYVVDDCEASHLLTDPRLIDAIGTSPERIETLMVADLNFRGMPEPRWPARASDDDLAVLLYTSGTSGRPKGVMLTHGNLSANVSQILRWVDLGDDDVVLGVLPQFHSFGLTVLTLVPLTAGFKVVYSARFVPNRIVKLFHEHRPTLFLALPTMYNALMSVRSAEPDDFASLRYAVSGGEPLPDAVYERFLDRFGVSISEGYGLTETGPATNWCRPQEFKRHCVGRPLPEVEQVIVDVESGRHLGRRQEGEIRMKGPNVMPGYFKLPDESARAFDENGYFRSGDIGMHDEDGQLSITGRIKEMMIIGGENVFPREIEEVLNRHPSVKASGVVGVTDHMRGEIPVAFVELTEDASFDEKELKSWCRQNLAGYKTPKSIVCLDELPRNPTGKILRRELSERAKSAAVTESRSGVDASSA